MSAEQRQPHDPRCHCQRTQGSGETGRAARCAARNEPAGECKEERVRVEGHEHVTDGKE